MTQERTMLEVPDRFNRNSPTVTALMPPEQAGLWLLERMRQHVGFESWADRKLLDFGCGVRFSQAIINSEFAIGAYCGLDNHLPLIEFLRKAVQDHRFTYAFLDAHQALYNPTGQPLTEGSDLPIADRDFDLVSMFSVITHQNPVEARSIFSVLRRYIRVDGRLFFTYFRDESIATYEDRSPQGDGGSCFYNPRFLTDIVEGCGWRVVRGAPGEGPLIACSFVCAPA
jgi:SAM-dependent methyltransferase